MKKVTVIITSVFTALSIFTTSAFADTDQQQPARFEVGLVKDLPKVPEGQDIQGHGFVNVYYDDTHLYAAAAYFDGKLYISREVLAKAFPDIEMVENESTTVFKKGNRIAEAERFGSLRLDGAAYKGIKAGYGAMRTDQGDRPDELVPLRAILEHLGYKVKYKSSAEIGREAGTVEVY